MFPAGDAVVAMVLMAVMCLARPGIAELELISCSSLESLPPELGTMSLTRLDCQGCAALTALPASITRYSPAPLLLDGMCRHGAQHALVSSCRLTADHLCRCTGSAGCDS